MPLRIGLIGCGKIARVGHAPGYNQVRGAKIVSLFDIDPARSSALRDSLAPGAECFGDLDAFFASGLDAVSVCAPNRFHYPYTMQALKAGLHVLCEKPMAGSLADATRMIEAAKKAGKTLHINQSLRYFPVFQTVAALCAKGAVGEIVHLRCLRASGSPPDESWAPGSHWYVQKSEMAGIVLEIGVHMAEMMQWCAGKVRRVAAVTDSRLERIDCLDNMTALMDFESGATGTLSLSWTLPAGGYTLEIHGTRGSIRMKSLGGENPIELTAKGPKGMASTHPKLKTRAKSSYQCFIEAAQGKAPSPTPGELGREAISLCLAIMQSGETGRFVPVKHFDS